MVVLKYSTTRQVRRGGREAEGDGLLNRYTVKSCIGGSNPPLSASSTGERAMRRYAGSEVVAEEEELERPLQIEVKRIDVPRIPNQSTLWTAAGEGWLKPTFPDRPFLMERWPSGLRRWS